MSATVQRNRANSAEVQRNELNTIARQILAPSLDLDSKNGALESQSLVNFTRSSVKQYFGSDGLMAEAAVDTLPVSYDPATGRRLGWLIEESRTNEIPYSRDFTQPFWDASDNASKALDAVGLDGQANSASTITDDDSGTAEYARGALTIPDDSNTNVASIFIKKVSSASSVIEIYTQLQGGTTEVEKRIRFNPETGEIDPNSNDLTLEDWGDWWRVISVLQNNGSGNTGLDFRIYPARSDLSFNVDSSLTDSIVVDQAQVELNASFPTSPIITGGSAVTRSADLPEVNDMSWYPSNQGGTMYAQISKADADFTGIGWQIDDGASDDRLAYIMGSDNDLHQFISEISGSIPVSIFDQIGKPEAITAVTFTPDYFRLSVDGRSVQADNSGGIPPVTRLTIGGRDGDNIINGYVKFLKFYRVRFPDAKVQGYSTIRPSLVLDFTNENLHPLLNFTRSSSAWYWGADGKLQESPNDGLRIDYDPATGDVLGLLIEESRTNEVLDSRDFNTGNWILENGSIGISQDETGIDGKENTAFTLTDSDGGISSNLRQIVSIPDDNSDWTYSVFVKKDNNESRFPRIDFRLTGGTAVLRYDNLNTKTGALTNGGESDGSASVEDYGDFWRVILTLTNNGTGNTSAQIRIIPADTTTAGSIGESITGSTIYDHNQLENASFPTSPIITQGSPVTRSADVADITDLSWYNPSSGTFVVSFIRATFERSENMIRALNFGDLRYLYTTSTVEYGAFDGANTIFFGGTIPTLGTTERYGITYRDGQAVQSVNGNNDGAGFQTFDTKLKGITGIDIGLFLGHWKRIEYYPAGFSQSELDNLTS